MTIDISPEIIQKLGKKLVAKKNSTPIGIYKILYSGKSGSNFS